jgi:hypothetical protein
MRNFVVKAFDDYVVGTTNVYTPTDIAELLGSADRLCCVAVAHATRGTSPTVTFQFEHSVDTTRWVNQNSSPEVSSWAPSGGGANFLNFTSTRIPTLNYVRLRMALGGTTPGVSLEVWICGRSPNR